VITHFELFVLILSILLSYKSCSGIFLACPTLFLLRKFRGRAFGPRSVLQKTKAASSSWGAKRLFCFLQQELKQRPLSLTLVFGLVVCLYQVVEDLKV